MQKAAAAQPESIKCAQIVCSWCCVAFFVQLVFANLSIRMPHPDDGCSGCRCSLPATWISSSSSSTAAAALLSSEWTSDANAIGHDDDDDEMCIDSVAAHNWPDNSARIAFHPIIIELFRCVDMAAPHDATGFSWECGKHCCVRFNWVIESCVICAFVIFGLAKCRLCGTMHWLQLEWKDCRATAKQDCRWCYGMWIIMNALAIEPL